MPRHRAADQEAATRVAAVMALSHDDAPTDQIRPGIETAATDKRIELAVRNGRRDTNAADATVASFVTRLANLAEHDRWSTIYQAEVKTLVKLGELLEQMERNVADRSHVDHDLIRQLVAQSANWASQVGAITDDQGGAS